MVGGVAPNEREAGMANVWKRGRRWVVELRTKERKGWWSYTRVGGVWEVDINDKDRVKRI